MTNLLKIESYNPSALFDDLMTRLHANNDAALARKLGVTSPAICKMRHKKAQITAALLVRAHDITGESLDSLRLLAGIPKTPPLTKLVPLAEEMAE